MLVVSVMVPDPKNIGSGGGNSIQKFDRRRNVSGINEIIPHKIGNFTQTA